MPPALGLALLPLTLTAKVIGSIVCWARTPYPEMSEEEEQQIAPVIQWRKETDSEFDRLFQISQDEIDKKAKSWGGWIVKNWDSYLDTPNAYYNEHNKDYRTFDDMVYTRKRRVGWGPAISTTNALATGAILAGGAVLAVNNI